MTEVLGAALDAQQQGEARRGRRRSPGPPQGSGVREEIGVQVVGVDVGDHDVGVDLLAPGQAHAGHPVAVGQHRPDIGTGAHLHAGRAEGLPEGRAEGGQAAPDVPGAEVLLDVGDAGQRGGRRGGRARIGGVPAGPLDEAGVGEGAPGPAAERAQRVDGEEVPRRPQAADQVAGRPHGTGQERAVGHLPGGAGPVEEAAEGGAGPGRKALGPGDGVLTVGPVLEAGCRRATGTSRWGRGAPGRRPRRATTRRGGRGRRARPAG